MKKQFDLDGINENAEEKAARAKGVGAHLSKYNKIEAELVLPGEIVAYVGNTGNSAGAHLHLEVFECDNSIEKQTVINLDANENIELKWKNSFNYRSKRVNPFNHNS